MSLRAPMILRTGDGVRRTSVGVARMRSSSASSGRSRTSITSTAASFESFARSDSRLRTAVREFSAWPLMYSRSESPGCDESTAPAKLPDKCGPLHLILGEPADAAASQGDRGRVDRAGVQQPASARGLVGIQRRGGARCLLLCPNDASANREPQRVGRDLAVDEALAAGAQVVDGDAPAAGAAGGLA